MVNYTQGDGGRGGGGGVGNNPRVGGFPNEAKSLN